MQIICIIFVLQDGYSAEHIRSPWTNMLLVSNNISLVCLIILLHLETWPLEFGDFH